MTITNLGHLGWSDTNNVVSICVTSPKVVMARAVFLMPQAVSQENFANVNTAKNWDEMSAEVILKRIQYMKRFR